MHQKKKAVLFALIGTVVVLNLFVAGLFGYALNASKMRKEQEVRTTVENLALLLDQSVTGHIREINLSLTQIQAELEQDLREGRFGHKPERVAMLSSHENWLSQVAEIRVTDARGTVLFGHGVTPAIHVSYGDREFFGIHSREPGRGLVSSKLLEGRINKRWVVVFSRRYNHPGGAFAGVITAAVPASHFEKLLSGLQLGPRGIALMRDMDRSLIARVPPLDAAAGRTGARGGSREVTAIVNAGVPTATFYSDNTADGINRIDAYRKLSLMPAFVVVGLGEEDYLAQWRVDVRKAVMLSATFFVVTLCAGGLLWFVMAAQERATRRSEILLRHASDGIHIVDEQGFVIEASDAFCRMLGLPRERVIGMKVAEWEAVLNEEEIRQKIALVHASSAVHTFESVHRDSSGRTYPVEITSCPLLLEGRRVVFTSARDITERKQAEQAQRIAATAFESQVGMLIADREQVILRVNAAFTEVTGFLPEEVVGRTPRLFASGRHDAAFYAAMWHQLRTQGSWQGEIWNRRKSGEVYPQALSIGAVKDEAGEVTHYVATFIDITSRKSSEEQVRQLAFFDPLTRLPNRRLLMERLERALRECHRHRSKGALLFVDLDNFKSVNDTVGHHEGDRLLEQVAGLLLHCVDEHDTVARLGGDEFIVMLEELGTHDLEAAQKAEAVGQRILHALHRTYQLGHSEHRCSASIGVTLFGYDPNESVNEPLKRADLAMYQAKVAGRNDLRFFDPQMQADIRARAELDAGLWEAIEKGQFFLQYQPQVASDGRILGVEALVRWRHPERGLVSPAAFIPVAEDNGVIVPLGRWVLQTACLQLADWATQPDRAELSIAVNVSARQFRQPDFVTMVLDVVAQTGANPARLKLELTESSLVTEVEGMIAKMEALKATGVRFSLDDFGTGYSSLAYLKRLPLDQLKIDQGFVRDILVDPNDAAISRMVIVLAESLGLSVIAEGVETAEQRDFLARQGCLAYQGYLFSRPLPVAELEAFLDQAGAEALA